MEQSSPLSPAKQALLEQRLKGVSRAPASGHEIPRRPDRDSAPLSFTQHQMWVIDRLTPGNAAYNLPYGYRLRGPLNVTALEDSFNAVITRHESLRTTFAVKDGEPQQIIHPALAITITVTALDHLTGEEREDRLQALASEEAVRPFDLSRLPLIRASLFTLGDAEQVLIVNLHHIVADGLSIGLMMNELDAFYRVFTGSSSQSPPALPVQYGDFAAWQRRTAANEAVYAKQIEFWRTQLGGRLPVLELPADKPRPPLQSFNGANVFFSIPAAVAQQVKSLGAREGCTFFMTALAAFQVLLHRHSGAEDMVIGTPVATRSHREVEPLIGLVLNMAALRCDLAGNPTFVELLRRTRETTLNAFSNSDIPFEAMLEHVAFERDPSRNPIFQVALQVMSTAAPRLGDLDVSAFHFDLKFAQFDVTLHLYEEAGGYQGRFEYCSDLFDAETIHRLCARFTSLLDAIARDPERSIASLPMSSDPERRQLLVEWNDTKTDYPADALIHELFAAQAGSTPHAVAVEYEGRQLTYAELDARANQVAHYLARHGVGPDLMVGLCVERSLEMVVGLLGILKAGGAYLPLDPDYPAPRLTFMLDDTAAPLLLTQAKLRDRLSGYKGRTVCLDADWPEIARERPDAPSVRVSARNLAYVIYTSGSTGQPKGTCIEHRSVVRLVKSTNYKEFGPHEVFLQCAPLSFDASTFELWGSLLNGARLVVCPAGPLSLDTLARVIEERGVTTLLLVSAVFHQMVDQHIESLRGVRHLLAGGEALSVSHVRRMLAVIGEGRLINGYGPTENTTFTCCHVMTKDSRIGLTVPIGRPVSNTLVYVLDDDMRPVPVDVYGELYIGGDGLARGYLNRPELTSEKFVSDPFSSEAGARLYRSGDRVRFRADGTIEFAGRVDKQVKIRGVRVELGEIEATLNQHPLVRESVAVARQDTPGDTRLVAYIVPNQGVAPTIRELRSVLKTKLPDYMVPAAFVLLDSLPLTPNGKVDTRALPSPGRAEQYERNEYVAPRDETERVLCRVWSEVLGVHRVGLDDDFFALGGHSLLAARLFVQLDEEFGRSLPLGVLFAAPTVRSLAEHYRTAQGAKHSAVVVALRAGGTLRPLFAVPGIYGNVVGFANLARELGPEQPFYGLQSVGLDGTAAPLDSIEEMARVYVTEIRSVQVRGPYAIVGACFGATVAYEMARQLLDAGEEVAFLGLLSPTDREGHGDTETHTPVPRAYTRTMALAHYVTKRLQLYRREMRRLSFRERIGFVVGKGSSLLTSAPVKNRLKAAQRQVNQIEVYRANILALDRYHRKSLSGRLRAFEVFEVTESLENSQERIDWSSFWTGETRLHYAGGKNSGDMLRGENAPVIGEMLAARLQACVDGESGRSGGAGAGSHEIRRTG